MMVFSPPQQAVMRHAHSARTSIFAGGAVRSGKSYAVTLSFALWLAGLDTRHDHAVVGQSIESVMRNMGFDFIELANGMRGCSAELNKTFGTRIIVQGQAQQNVWLIGANDAKARRRIQGATLRGLVVEELPLLPEDFFNMAWSRLSESHAKMWASYNPEGPAHWAKKRCIDRCDDYGGTVVRFKMRDNPTLEEDVIARYERSFVGHFYQRYIAGEWAAAAGACYPAWYTTNRTDLRQWRSWHLAFDWAVSGTMAALCIATHARKGSVVAHELYHEGRTEGLLNEVEVGERLDAWWKEVCPQHTGFVWMDPATPATFKRIMRQRGFAIRSVDNDVVPGIVTTAARLANRDILIHDRCAKLQEELAGYVWDDAAAAQGEDKPVKKADHGCDALRYWAHSTGKVARIMHGTTIREALR